MASSLSERDKKVIWHPYTPQKYAPDPIPIIKGSGVYLEDEQGNTYIDAISSWWVTIHGHAHPHIAERIYRQALQLEQVIFAGFTHIPAIELAEKLVGLLPGNMSRIFYSDNGSTAVEAAIKMAIQFWWNKGEKKRNRILALTHSYHGDTFGAMSVSERGIFTLAFRDHLFDVLFAETPATGVPLTIQGYAAEEIPALLESCACVIYEPLLQGAGGMIMYDKEALDEFLQTCRKNGLICIADEVMTGFGRTGKLFASEHCVTQPDIFCLSKGLTGGTMAMGVTACNDRIYQAFVDDDKLKSLFHGHSFTANPIACSASLASLDLVNEKIFMENIKRIGEQHVLFMETLKQGGFPVKNIRCCGTIIAFEVTDTADTYMSGIKEIFTENALKEGVYLRPLGNTVYLMPPYCITNGELGKVYQVVISILKEMQDKQ